MEETKKSTFNGEVEHWTKNDPNLFIVPNDPDETIRVCIEATECLFIQIENIDKALDYAVAEIIKEGEK